MIQQIGGQSKSGVESMATTAKSASITSPSEYEQQIAEYRKIIRELDAKLREEHALGQTMAQTCAQLQTSLYQMQMQQQAAAVAANSAASEHTEAISERLRLQARIGELEVKVNLLDER